MKISITSFLPLAALMVLGTGCATEPGDGSLGVVEAEPGGGSLSTLQGALAPGQQAALIAHEAAGPATQVRVVDLSSGAPEAVGQASIAPDGSFSVEVPAGAQRLIVTAVDQSGSTAAAGIMDVSAPAGGVAEMADLGPESTLEAEAARDLVACGISMLAIDTVDLRARISEALATAALAAIEAGAAAEELVHGLAQAIGAAQATELAALSMNGVTVTRQALFESGLPASTQLQRDLSAGADPGEATAAFAAAAQEARAALVGPEANARSQVASAIAFGATAEEEEGGLAGQFEEIDAVIDEVLIAAAAPLGLEAVIVALDDLMDPVFEGALHELDELLEGLGLASLYEGTLDQVVDTLTGLLGGILTDGGILGDLLGLGGLLGGDFDEDVLALAVERRAELEAEVVAAIEAAAGAGQCIDFDSLGDEVALSGSEFSADVHDGVSDLAGGIILGRPSPGELAAMSEILALLEGLRSVAR